MPEQTAKQITLFTQEDVNYTPVSTAKGKACSACRFYCDEGCHIVMGEIAPNGYCDRYETVPPPPPPPDIAPIPVTIVEAPEMEMGEMSMKTVDEDGLFLRIWERVKTAIIPAKPDGVFTVQKDLKGQWRWVATYTNNFQDRDGEIISEKALDGYLERVSLGLVPMPELWVGHVKGTRHGVADMVFAVGNFVTATGTFDDTPEARKAIEFYRKGTKEIALSHGFTYPSWGLKNGIYEVVNTFEISTLPPPMVASNPFTEFEVESMKQYTPEQKAAVAKTYGQDFADKFFTSLEKQSEDIKAAGTAFKDFAQVTEEAPAKTEDTPANVADLLTGLIEGQAELLSVLAAQGKAIQATKEAQEAKDVASAAKVAALESTVTKLQAQIGLTPRAASSAQETKLSADDAKEFKQQLEQSEADPFFS